MQQLAATEVKHVCLNIAEGAEYIKNDQLNYVIRCCDYGLSNQIFAQQVLSPGTNPGPLAFALLITGC